MTGLVKRNNITLLKKIPHTRYWLAKCDCGNVYSVRRDRVMINALKSCGCMWYDRLVKAGQNNIRHGCSRRGSNGRTSEYVSWQHMKDRCLNPKNQAYKYYGGRGITINNRWIKDFQNFLHDLGIKSDPNYVLDRINPNGNYTSSNCRWVSKEISYQNKRPRGLLNG